MVLVVAAMTVRAADTQQVNELMAAVPGIWYVALAWHRPVLQPLATRGGF